MKNSGNSKKYKVSYYFALLEKKFLGVFSSCLGRVEEEWRKREGKRKRKEKEKRQRKEKL